MGLIYIIVGVLLFVAGLSFIVSSTRFLFMSIGLVLALVGTGKYAAEQISEYVRRRND